MGRIKWAVLGGLWALASAAALASEAFAWDARDHLAFAALLLGPGLVEEAARPLRADARRWAGLLIILGGLFLLAWGNAAVGLFGSADADVNMLVWPVIALGILGCLRARADPRRLARTAAALAGLQVVITAMAAVAHPLAANELVTSLVFVGLWLAARHMLRPPR